MPGKLKGKKKLLNIIERKARMRGRMTVSPSSRTITVAPADVKKITLSLADGRFEWRSIKGVSSETGVPADQVLGFIKGNPDIFIQSRVPDKNGRELFATRKHYRATHSFLRRAMDVYRTTST